MSRSISSPSIVPKARTPFCLAHGIRLVFRSGAMPATSVTISTMRKPNTQYVKPYQSNQVFGSHAIATSVEVGYDIFSQIEKLRTARQKMYVFGHFEYYNSCLGGSKEYTSKKIFFV